MGPLDCTGILSFDRLFTGSSLALTSAIVDVPIFH